MAFTNSQMTTLVDAIKAVGKVDNAQVAFAKRVASMKDAGFKAEWFETKSERIEEIRAVIAQTALTSAQYTIWADISLAKKVSVKGSDKRIDTPRGKLVKQVDQRIARLRKALSEPATKEAKQPGSARALDKRILQELGNLKKAVNVDKAKEEPTLECDHRELVAAFDRITDILTSH